MNQQLRNVTSITLVGLFAERERRRQLIPPPLLLLLPDRLRKTPRPERTHEKGIGGDGLTTSISISRQVLILFVFLQQRVRGIHCLLLENHCPDTCATTRNDVLTSSARRPLLPFPSSSAAMLPEVICRLETSCSRHDRLGMA